MATLNLNEKKIASAENLRLLSSLILSLSSKQGTIENKLINNWVASTAYIKDESFVIYDELLYVCKISNADNTFDKNKWTCLSPVIEELTKADIEALINLNPEEISKLSDLISTEIRLDKTFSSSDTYTRIQAAIDTAKEYTNNQLGKAVKPAYKVVASTSEVTETGYFYLISNGTNYDMYVFSADSSVVSLGTSDVDLSNYYTKTEVDNDFLKKTDATSTYATITTVDGKVDKTNVLTALGSSATDEQVYSAKVVNAELDGVVKKTDISTTIDSTSTDDKIPTNKAVYDSAIKNKKLKTYSISAADDFPNLKTLVDISDNLPSNSIVVLDSGYDSTSFFGLPSNKFEIVWVRRYSGRDSIMAYTTTGLSYICTNIKNQTWKRVCTTSVADVPLTNITIPDGLFQSVNEVSYIKYEIVNGIAFVYFNIRDAKFVKSGTSLNTTVPKIKSPFNHTIIGENINTALTIIANGNNMQLWTLGDETTVTHYSACISYPVAEN